MSMPAPGRGDNRPAVDYPPGVLRMRVSPIAGLALAVTLSACVQGGSVPVGPVPRLDPGAAAREAALARYADGTGVAATDTPSIVGRTPVQARQLLAAAGLDLRVVAFDRTKPVTAQYPRAGQPVPIDGVVEGWLGEPPREVVETAATAAATAPAVQTPIEPTAPAPAEPATAAPAREEVATRYVLPPHTAGLLRVNPRRLPAVPLGTELTGDASWYGPGFHGLRTACGGVYDQDGATLATRELRCGTVVRITGPTGLTVEATVTDWGPAEWTGRRFDLSAAVFNAIAPLGAGVVPVRVITASVPR